ncbi:MAG: flagellar protein FlaG [Bryobacteraceae bacterium]
MKIDSSLPALDLVNLPQRRIVEQQQHRDLIQAARAVNASEMMGNGQELTFSLDQHTGRVVIRLVKRETGEVLQQIPAEDILRMAQSLKLAARPAGQ